MSLPFRTSSSVAILALLAACSSNVPLATESASQPQAPGGSIAAFASLIGDDDVVAGEINIKLKGNADLDAVTRRHGLGVNVRGNKFHRVKGAAGSEKRLVAELSNDPDVEWAEPNYIRHLHAIDPKLWAFYNPGGLNMKYTSGKSIGQNIGASYASIVDADEDNVDNGYAAGGSDVVIGSIDTGVDFGHSEFTGRLIAGKDWVNNDANPADDDGHGTHTTGIMAGSTVGVAGVSGAASHVKVYVQKVCGKNGCPTSAIVNAIYAAADYPGMVAINMSLGGGTESKAEKDAIAYATSKGVLVIASAGNEATSHVDCPACDVNAISVGATNWRDALTYYTNWGAGLDITAPGGECYSNTTADGCIWSSYLGGGYAYLQGTSMAAPQVTGTAAIVASKTGLRGTALRNRILSTTDDKGTNGTDTKFGSGRLNSYRAVTGVSLGAQLAVSRQ